MKQIALVLICIASLAIGQVEGLSGWNIVLDPGHSRTENMGIYNYSEAEKNVRVALALRTFLLQTTDIDTVYLTRTNDSQSVSLTQRTDYANSLGAAWYHSIHGDAGSPASNSTLLLWGQYRNGQEKVPPGGKKMSSYIVNILTRGMRTDTRGSIGDCSFYGCDFTGPYLHGNRESTMPSELSEAGFHTSPLQNQRNMNAEWKRLEAWTFYWSFLDFHKIKRPTVRILTGFVSDYESDGLINGAKITVQGKTYTTDTYASLFHKYSTDPEQLRNGFYYFENLTESPVTMLVEAPDHYSDTLQVALSDTFFTFKDIKLISKQPPFVVSSTPAAGADKFPAWEAITLRFSRPVKPASVEQAWSMTPPSKGTFTWLDGDRSVTFRPDTLAYETEYILTLSAEVVDRYGHHLDGDRDGGAGDSYELKFKTGPADLFPPRVTGSLPKYGATNVDLQPIISFYYSEPIDAASFNAGMVKMFRYNDNAPIAGLIRHYVVKEKSIISFFPAQPLQENQVYKIQIDPGIKDRLGNVETQSKSLAFKTGSTHYQVTEIDRFDSDLSYWFVPQASGSTTGILTDQTAVSLDTLRANLLSKSQKSMRLDYGWDLGQSNWLIREYLNAGPAKAVRFDNSYMLQAWVFGDASGTLFRFCVDDRIPTYAAANHEVSPWYTIDWLGWKLVQWDLASEPAGTWLGDGQLDGTLGFDSIQLAYSSGAASSGTIFIDDLQVAKKMASRVEEEDASRMLPILFNLEQNYPNPFNSETTIRYQLNERAEQVTVTIFDLIGRTVRTLVEQAQPAGEHVAIWDGCDENRRPVASGVYLYQLRTEQAQQTRQMVLMR